MALSSCLSVKGNLSRLKLDGHKNQHVGILGTWECSCPSGFLNFDLLMVQWPFDFFSKVK